MSATTEIQDFNKRVCLKNAGAQAITGSVDNVITWDTEIMDTDSMHEGVTNPSRITFNTAGDYVVGAEIFSIGVVMTVKINLGGTPTVIAEEKNSQGAYIKVVYTFAEGDYIYVTANPSATDTLETTNSFFAYRIG